MSMKEILIEQMREGIQEVVPEENWGDIPSFFEKVYVVKYNEFYDAYVVGYWDQPNPLLAIDAEEYEFLGVVMQDWVEEHGTRIV